MSVWICDEKLLIFASLISPSKMILFEKKYQTFDTVFHHQMKHLEVQKYSKGQKYSAARRIFNSLLGVSSGNETLHLMFDILLQKPSRCIPNNFLKASITTDTMKIFSITFCTLVTVYYLQNSERRFQHCALCYNFLHPALCCSSFDLKTVICLRLYICSWYVQFCMLLKDSVLVLWINKFNELQCSFKTSVNLVLASEHLKL